MRTRLLVVVLGAALLASACGIARPLPNLSPPSSGKHHTVLLMGDSLMERAVPEITETLANRGMSATVRNEAHGLAGLLMPSLETLETEAQILQRSIAAYHPTIVVFHYFGVHWGFPPVASETYYQWWRAESRRLTGIAHDAGAAVYWIVPPVQPAHPEWDRIAFEYLFLPSFFSANPPVRTVDWRTAFRPVNDTVWLNGTELHSTYANDLLYPEDDGVRRVRSEDFHFTSWGDWRAAWWLAAAMRPLWD